jgi:hypothetical protein
MTIWHFRGDRRKDVNPILQNQTIQYYVKDQ